MSDKVIIKNGRIFRFIPDCYKNKNMCDKAVGSFSHALEFVSDCHKTQNMCNKVVDTYPSAIQFFPECGKAVDTCPFVFDSVPDRYKPQDMCDKAAFEEPFMLKYFLDRYKTKEMYDNVADVCLPALKLTPDWFVADKMFEKFEYVVFFNDDIDYTLILLHYLAIFISFFKLLDNNSDEDDPETIVLARLIAWCKRYKQRRACKEKLMPIAWH